MNEERVRQIVRQFQENALKQVLTSPGNLRELLMVAKAAVLPRLEFAGMTVEPTTFVTAEYRHVSSDLVLTLTLLPSRKSGRKRRLTVTILIELQTQPDRLMLLRVLDYLVQIWKQQVKRHGERHKSLANVQLTPVLPVVLHTGSYSWEKLGRLVDLMDDAEDLAPVTPAFEPVFVSLPNVSEAELEQRGGSFGQVLALLKMRKARREQFARRLEQTVAKLGELKGTERLRRLELLSYVEGLVYHAREAQEHKTLRERIDAVLRDDEARLEVDMVRRSMADVHRDEISREVMLAERKRTLLRLLGLRWGSLPAETKQVIEATQDANQLEEWLGLVITADNLDAVGIAPPD
ncbi:MAG TPA: Rpn family recombination-promoting nuclease/putative transposase [Gemmataceae bacterium]|nr:Rpn family recombination-promoting nuclease/putative transposase [Gemmataceae bacterium]